MGEISSSAVRAAIEKGEAARERLPESVYNFILATGVYGPRYEIRSLLLDRLYGIREWAESEVDLRRLLDVAGEDSRRGIEFRDLLKSPAVNPCQLKDFILSL